MKRISICFLSLFFLALQDLEAKFHHIAIIGTGYVGLVTGTCLAEHGHYVICADTDVSKINLLINGKIPIYEPQLEDLIKKNYEAGRLNFTNDCDYAIKQAELIFVTVGTPTLATGECDLTALMEAIATIARHLDHYKIICIKSTIPIHAIKKIKDYLIEKNIQKDNYDLVCNPEFLREGNALFDFFNPDRIVLGLESEKARISMEEIYASFRSKGVPFLYTNFSSAQAIKYASNAFLANKISFINEIANFCDVIGADIKDVAHGIGLDKRIGLSFLNPGPGFGGSCFPKDCSALLTMAQEYEIDLLTVKATLAANENQKKKIVQKIMEFTDYNVIGKKIAILGLTFKAHTDDIRNSAAITAIDLLLFYGATIKVYDPVAHASVQHLFPAITYCNNPYDAVTDAEVCVILTEWPEFTTLNLEQVYKLMKRPCIIDMRNILDTTQLIKLGFHFDCLGRNSFLQKVKEDYVDSLH